MDTGWPKRLSLREQAPSVARQTGSKVSWSPADSMECPQCLTQKVAPIISTAYFITIADNVGCTARDQVTGRVDRWKHLYVPNVFSPNGDGRNDKFTIFAKPNTVGTAPSGANR